MRWQRIIASIFQWKFAKAFPGTVKHLLIQAALQQVPGMDSRHFQPSYNPWDQRICACPDGDFFKSIRKGNVSVETDEIERFVKNGLKLRSGQVVEADLIVTATGMNMQPNMPMGSVDVSVDGRPYIAAEHFMYRGMMLNDVPNLFFSMGYFNASWTLRVELTCRYVGRLLNFMDRQRYCVCVPRAPSDFKSKDQPALTSGYVLRNFQNMPKEGLAEPWNLKNNYLSDRASLEWSSLSTSMEFGRSHLMSKL